MVRMKFVTELLKGESEAETVEELFSKMRNEFGETAEEEQKIEQLRTIEQEERTCDEYCKDLDWDVLELLLVQVDKENSMEFSLIMVHYLYTSCVYFYL